MAANPSCILFRNDAKGVYLIDIPRSLEESQVLVGQIPPRRIRSAAPLAVPYPTPEPRDADLRRMARTPAELLGELQTQHAAQLALNEIRVRHSGPFCLPRIIEPEKGDNPGGNPTGKRDDEGASSQLAASSRPFIPERSHHLHGSIQDLRALFLANAPPFDLIILDPPWPNRSARRKTTGSYASARNLDEIGDLLTLLPITSHLSADGLVAMWVTNKQAAVDLVASLFASQWGNLDVVAEWTWLKVTAGGEPIVDLESVWRKPWERLLVAQRKGAQRRWFASAEERRVLVAVPDVHSRKPNLRPLFDEVLPQGYAALEMFARNLTAGWWSWGDEVLRFQTEEHWVGTACEDELKGAASI